MIELKNVSKTFDSGTGEVDALKNVSLTIRDGDIYGIIGMSGAGKSTLVRCINLLEKPSSGEMHSESPSKSTNRRAKNFKNLLIGVFLSVLLSSISITFFPPFLKTKRTEAQTSSGENLLFAYSEAAV